MRSISQADQIHTDAQRLHELVVAFGRIQSLRDPMRERTSQLHFTPPQFHTLFWLGVDGTLPMGEIAAHCGITEKTITGVVDRLEREGYVQRTRDAEDRRVVHVRLSRKGATTFRRLERGLFAKLSRFLSLIEPADRRSLLGIMERLLRRVTSTINSENSRRVALH